jgi:hypothetical protein
MALRRKDRAGAAVGASEKAERDSYETLALRCDEDPRAIPTCPVAQVVEMAIEVAVEIRGPPNGER